MTCTICNTTPGEPAQLVFAGDDAPISLEMCDDCFADFRDDEAADIAWIGPEVA